MSEFQDRLCEYRDVLIRESGECNTPKDSCEDYINVFCQIWQAGGGIFDYSIMWFSEFECHLRYTETGCTHSGGLDFVFAHLDRNNNNNADVNDAYDRAMKGI